jgi:hypothetical protein
MDRSYDVGVGVYEEHRAAMSRSTRRLLGHGLPKYTRAAPETLFKSVVTTCMRIRGLHQVVQGEG